MPFALPEYERAMRELVPASSECWGLLRGLPDPLLWMGKGAHDAPWRGYVGAPGDHARDGRLDLVGSLLRPGV